MERRTLEFLVGIFVVLGFTALFFVSMQAANLGNFSFGTHAYEVTANFDNIGGLKPRAPVKSAGVVVGRVKSISFDQETFQAKVVMDIEQVPGRQLGQDSHLGTFGRAIRRALGGR